MVVHDEDPEEDPDVHFKFDGSDDGSASSDGGDSERVRGEGGGSTSKGEGNRVEGRRNERRGMSMRTEPMFFAVEVCRKGRREQNNEM